MSDDGILIRGARIAADLTERGGTIDGAGEVDLRIAGGRIAERGPAGSLEPRFTTDGGAERVIEARGSSP